jgi:tetratricopeptide (TPR) repeat protein
VSGERLGPYELRAELGRGAAGSVHVAVDGRTGQEVALKVLLPAAEQARRRLVLEARALARLRHPHIVSLLDAGEDRGRPWLALELVRGRTLQARLDEEGPLAPREAARLVQRLADAVAHAHAAGVLHRDLKPDNVLLDEAGAPRLTDFGLAGFAAELSQSRLTRSGTSLGSPGYWAPEQAAGRTSELGPATDVYGLGGVLHACLTGRAPVEGASLHEVLIATESLTPEPSGRDPALDAIALRCLEKRPDARYPSAKALAGELSAYLAGRRRARPRRPVGAALAGLLLVAGAVVWRATSSPRGAPAPAPAPAAAPRPTPAPAPATQAATRVAAEPGRLVEQAEERRRRGDPRGAIALCDRALEAQPALALAYAVRGAARLDLDDRQGALADLDRAVELDPRSAQAHVDRGAARFRLGDREGALRDLDRAVELGPDLAVARARRSLVRGAGGDLDGAAADGDRALELDPRLGLAYTSRAGVREARGDLRGALADHDRALELEPGNARAHVVRSAVKQRLGDLQGALADCDRAVELDEALAPARVNRGVLRKQAGDLRGALADLDRAVELEPTSAWALANRASVRIDLGDAPGAVADATRALELDRRLVVAHLARGAARAALGEQRAAIEDYDGALELDPKHELALVNRGTAKVQLRDGPGAIADCGRAIALNPKLAQAWAVRGTARGATGDRAGAIADWEEALRLEPNARWSEDVRSMLARVRRSVSGTGPPTPGGREESEKRSP